MLDTTPSDAESPYKVDPTTVRHWAFHRALALGTCGLPPNSDDESSQRDYQSCAS